MYSPTVVMREAYYDRHLKDKVSEYAKAHGCSMEEATQSPDVQEYVRRHCEI